MKREGTLETDVTMDIIEVVLETDTSMDIVTVLTDSNEDSNAVGSAKKRKKRGRLHKRMQFASTLLFVIGSVLYLVMAVNDFQWAHELQTLPMWLRTADDDIAWMNYRLGERYSAPSLLEEEEEGAATSRSGGVRRTKSRELLIRLEEEENQARRKVQTPEELYHDEYWTDFPQEIQDAYAALGYTEELWELGESSSTGDSEWSELTAEQQEAALFIGYTEAIWCDFEGAVASTQTPEPTPGQPSFGTTPSPSTARPTTIQHVTDSSSSNNNGVIPASVQALQPASNPVPISSSSTNIAVTVSEFPASPTPEELYYDEWWKDLPQDIQEAYTVLGMNETMWSEAIKPETDEMFWDELTPEQRKSALFIGYTKEMWDTTSEPTALPIASSTNVTGTSVSVFNAPEAKIDEVTNTEVVLVGYYDSYTWVKLPPHIQEAAAALGYDQNLWDVGGISWSEDYLWDELTPEAQQAAALLGYDKFSWDGIDPITGAAVKAVDEYVYDDDFVFQVGSSDVWVSQYQIVNFFAALSFLIVGILDLIRERHVFRILMILAGAFGVLSAVYVEEDIRLSNIFNSVSVHFYLLEALTLFREHKCGEITVEVGKWIKFTMMFGDLEFIVGALFDVILSYFCVFDHTADWDISLMIVSIFGAVLWLHCSFIYMGTFLYDHHEATKMLPQSKAEKMMGQT